MNGTSRKENLYEGMEYNTDSIDFLTPDENACGDCNRIDCCRKLAEVIEKYILS